MAYNSDMKKEVNIAIFLTLLLLGGVTAWYIYGHNKKTDLVVTPSTIQNTTLTPTTETPTVTAATLYYPMTNFDGRITFRTFGQLVKPTDAATPCGVAFSGYHNADDLEITATEVGADVPVYAISSGVIREVGLVSGYGGLLVLGVTVNGQDYTVYYGHINLGSTNLVVGEAVHAGQRLASLGSQCSAQTSGERKHLHLAIHKGTSIDVRGYVPNLSELSAWIDPRAFFTKHSALEIK